MESGVDEIRGRSREYSSVAAERYPEAMPMTICETWERDCRGGLIRLVGKRSSRGAVNSEVIERISVL